MKTKKKIIKKEIKQSKNRKTEQEGYYYFLEGMRKDPNITFASITKRTYKKK